MPIVSWRDLSRILAKVIGVLLVATTLVGLPAMVLGLIGLLRAENGGAAFPVGQKVLWCVYGLAPSAFYLAMGAGLIFGSGRIVDRFAIAPRPQRQSADAFDRMALERLLVAIVGLFLLVDGMARLIGWIALILPPLLEHRANLHLILAAEAARSIEPIARILLGVALILRRHGFAVFRASLARQIQGLRNWPE
jgi:hypothetical protein